MDKAPETKEINTETPPKKNPVQDVLNKVMTRRKLFRDAATLTVAVAAGAKAGELASLSDQEVVEGLEPLPKPDVKRVDLSPQTPQLVISTPPESQPIPNNPKEKPSDLLEKYPEQDQASLKKRIDAEKDFLEKNYPKEKLKRILEKCIGYKSVINSVLENYKYDKELKNSMIPELLPGLIFQESQGNPKVKSGSDAVGLCQLMPKTADREAARLGIKLGFFKGKLKDPEVSIALGLKYLEELYNYFPDEKVAMWAYHMGEGNMAKVVARKLDLPDPSDEELVSFLAKCPDLIKQNSLNAANLLDSDYVQNVMVGDPRFDLTEIYLPRIIASYELMKELPDENVSRRGLFASVFKKAA